MSAKRKEAIPKEPISKKVKRGNKSSLLRESKRQTAEGWQRSMEKKHKC